MPADPVTILCTDLTRPEDLLDRLGRVAAEHGGMPLTEPPDVLAFTFTSPYSALSFARETQRATDRHGGIPTAKISVHTGEKDDVLDMASHMLSFAESGQVLVSDVVRSLVARTGGSDFRQLMDIEVPGAAAPVSAWEFLWREPEPRTRVRLCGTPGVEIDGRDVGANVGTGQAGELLWYLLANRERPIERAELIEIVWPDRQPKDPYSDLRPILSRVRRVLGQDAVVGRDQVRVALPEPVWVDVEVAARAIDGARLATRGGDWETVREESWVALEVLQHGFLPGHDREWVESRRRDLEELLLETLEWAARSSIALGGDELGTAERAARDLVARSPYRETGYRFLMESLAAGGNVAEALRVYEELRHLLREELGVTPAAELRALHARLLAEDAAGSAPPSSAASVPERVPLPVRLSPREKTAFIGRGNELSTLKAEWSSARSGGRRVVLLSGEPGIGKTRLMTELAQEVHADGIVLHGACQEEPLVSYQPFVEALRHYARSRPMVSAPVELGPGAGELVRLIPELADALPQLSDAPVDDPESRRYLMFEAVSKLLTEASVRAPLLLVLDDLQWADRPTLQLLRHIVRADREASLLILGAYRDAEIGAGHPLSEVVADLRRDKLLARVSITGLDERGVSALIGSHAGHDASSALVRTVHEATEGNPFFVEEVMRHLIETGVLFEREGRWSSALTPDEIGVPQGVKDVIGRRLEGLREGCRETLLRAAVLGREFSFPVLQQMVESDDEGVIAALEEALDAHLIIEVQDAPEPAFAFTHALVRETLHGSLSGPRRQQLHARAAQAIESAGLADSVAALAVHHRLAGSAGDPAKAIDYSLQAGDRARQLFAWEEAVAHWDGALAVMERTRAPHDVRARLMVALGDLLGVVGNLGGQIDYLERALALYAELGDDERTAQVHSRLGMAHSLIDSIYADHLDIHHAFRHYDTARPVLERGKASTARGHLEVGVATALTYGLQTGPGIESAGRAMKIAEEHGDRSLWAGAAEAYAWHKIIAGDLRAGLDTLELAFDAADRRRQSFLAWMASNIAAQLTWGLGDPDAAQVFVERSMAQPYIVETAHRYVVADNLGRCHASRGEIAEARELLSDAKPTWITHSLKPLLDLWDGKWDEVEALASRILETSRRTGNRWDEWASLHLIARVTSLRGEHERAVEPLERALDIVVDGGAVYFEMWVRPYLARAQVETGRLEDARRHVDRCLEILNLGEDWRGRAGHVALAEAAVLAVEGRVEAAADRFDEALKVLQRYKLPTDEAEALHQWGRSLSLTGAHSDAVMKFDAALDIYRRHGAGRPWLNLIDTDKRRRQKTVR